MMDPRDRDRDRDRLLREEWKTTYTPEYVRAVGIWCAYYRATDAYDELLGARRGEDGEIGPPPPWSSGASSQFAREMLRAVHMGARGISENDMRAARQFVLKHPKEAAQLYEQLRAR